MSRKRRLSAEQTQPYRIAEVIPRQVLSACLGRLDFHRVLLKSVRRILPPPLAEHCLECVAADKTLLLYADSAAWVSQLRFYMPQIIETLTSEGHGEFKQGKAKTLHLSLEAPRAPRPKPAPNRPVPATVASLEAAARASGGDIGAALLRLCGTLRRAPR